ncbi:MAG: sulfurase, partial [Pseudomonadota bacterium]
MSILKPTQLTGRVEALLLNPSRDDQLESFDRRELVATYAGLDGETHAGLTRPSCSRVLKQYPKRGTEIRNTRQVTIVSVEDLAAIASALDIPQLPPE